MGAALERKSIEHIESQRADILEFKVRDGRKGETEEKSEIVINDSIAYRFVKRLADVVLSLIALVVLSPVFLMTAVAIKLEDGENVIFTQDRSGLNGIPFKMYKFRSMCKDAPAMHHKLLKYNELDGPAFKMKDDPRLTRVGRFIRRTSIDELPQLINIIKGDMSIVGPRPLPVYETNQMTEEQNKRLLMKPGLTCYWQVCGRNDIGFAEWMELDRKYLAEAGVWTDIKMIIRTFGVVISKKGAE